MRPATLQNPPALAPGLCMRCRTGVEAGNRENWVDIGIDIPFEGVVYLCNLCLVDIVRTTGLPDLLVVKDHQVELDQFEVDKLDIEADRKALDLIKSHLVVLGLNFDSLLSAATENVQAQVAAGKVDPEPVLDAKAVIDLELPLESSVVVAEPEPEKIPDPEPFVFDNSVIPSFTFTELEPQPGADGIGVEDEPQSDGTVDSETAGSEPVPDEPVKPSSGKNTKS